MAVPMWGNASIWFALHSSRRADCCCRPEASNFELLERNTRHLAGIHAMHAAIWSERCQLTIANPAEEKWEFRMVRLAGSSIEAVTIPDLLQWAETDRIDLLKLDVEGAESEIFAAGSTWLERTHYLIIELHDYLIPGWWRLVSQSDEGAFLLKKLCVVSTKFSRTGPERREGHFPPRRDPGQGFLTGPRSVSCSWTRFWPAAHRAVAHQPAAEFRVRSILVHRKSGTVALLCDQLGGLSIAQHLATGVVAGIRQTSDNFCA